MARAVGQYEAMHRPANMKMFPYVIYRASVGSKTPRDSHKRYDGMVIDKRDPWLRTHWPPWEFGCNCDLQNCTAKKAETLGTVKPMSDPEDVKIESESGFSFDPATAFEKYDLSLIKIDEFRDHVAEELEQRFACKISDDGQFAAAPKEDETQKLQIAGRTLGPKIRKAIKPLMESEYVDKVNFASMTEDAEKLVKPAVDRIVRRLKEYGIHVTYIGTDPHVPPKAVFEARGPWNGRAELIFNANIFNDPDSLDARFDLDERRRYHPKGCNTITAYADHEISHLLFYIAKMEEDQEFMQYMRELKAQPDFVNDSISGYAGNYTNNEDIPFAQEVLAECFMSVKRHRFFPPKEHKKIVDMLEKRLKQGILQGKEKK